MLALLKTEAEQSGAEMRMHGEQRIMMWLKAKRLIKHTIRLSAVLARCERLSI